jgi:CBS domain-containing protein
MDSITARTIMRKPEVALRRLMTIDRVSDHLSKHQLPGAPVVNKTGELIGYISEYDCLTQLMQSSYYGDKTSLVEDVMSTKLIMSRPDIAVIDLASTMNANKVNVMPIVEAGKLIGAVSRGDIMRALVQLMSKQKTS